MIAYHEAGHAVAARVQGLDVPYVTLLRTSGTSRASAQHESAAWIARDADRATRVSALEKDAIVFLAGPAAQRRHRLPKNQDGWKTDLDDAKLRAIKAVLIKNGVTLPEVETKVHLNSDDAEEAKLLYNRLAAKTETLIQEKWLAITRVAEALLTRPVLNQDELDELIAGWRTRRI